MLEQHCKCNKLEEIVFSRKAPRKGVCLVRGSTSISYLDGRDDDGALKEHTGHHTAF